MGDKNKNERGRTILAAPTRRYVAVIADMVGSRNLEPTARGALQKKFGELMDRFNRDYREAIAAKFVITLGDEFQALLNSTALIPDLIYRLEEDLPERQFRLGIGIGTLVTPLREYAINIDGPSLHIARKAIEYAKNTKALGGVFLGVGDLEEILNGMARLLWFHRFHWTRPQRKIAGLLRQGMSQAQVAKRLRITKQVVSRQVLAAGCYQYIAAENAWRMILQRQVDPLLGQTKGRLRHN
jgi:hypothetical protein